MKQRKSKAARLWPLRGPALLASGLVLAVALRAQLAITEMMTYPSESLAGQVVAPGSDFWELTNFSTNTIDLTGYSWSDQNSSPNPAPFAGVTIRPGESIVFFRLDKSTNAHAFRQWWGLTDTVQVIPWGIDTGLNKGQEGVRLWDARGAAVDSVNVGPAQQGVSFTYDPETGVFGALSVKGVGGAFPAVTADDIGSPGVAAGPVRPSLIEAPSDLEVDGGQDATFAVRATGVPPPHYRWLCNGRVIEEASSATLTLSNVQPSDAGLYEVRVDNCVGWPTSAVATLTVKTDPSPPTIIRRLEDVTTFPGQAVRLTVRARGYPALNYRWLENGVESPQAHGSTLEITDPQQAQSGTRYTVEVRNAMGVAASSACLWVRPKPKLCITEVMAWPSTNTVAATADWWELTNLDTNAVSLQGWKFFDISEALVRGTPCTNTQAVTVQPGESIIFVEGMTPEGFVAWWGATNLPPRLTIIPYGGFSLRAEGDTLYLWNPTATDPYDATAQVFFEGSLRGVTLQWAPGARAATDSNEGVDGVFRAAESDDLGSPGYSHYAPPRFVDVAVEREHVILTWSAVAGRKYVLRCRANLEDACWIALGTYVSPGRFLTARDDLKPGDRQRFYRVEIVP